MSVKLLVTIDDDDIDPEEEANGLGDVIGGYAEWPFTVEVVPDDE
jgi:hypothetical protein